MAIKTCTVLEAFKVNHDESFSLVKWLMISFI
jgi:hypothetical protein